MPTPPPDQTPPPRPPPSDRSSAAGAAETDGRATEESVDYGAELNAALSALLEIPAYAQQFVNAKISATLYTARKIALMAVLGLISGLAGISIVVTSAALLVIGFANLISALVPEGWKWAGPVLVGLIGVGMSTIGAWLVVRRAAAAGREAAAQGYRETLLRQRQQFGVDAMSRAAEREVETGKSTRPPEREAEDRHPPGIAGDEEELNEG